MEHIDAWIVIFAVIIATGHIFRKSPIPIALILVIIGILIGHLSTSSAFNLSPDVTLNLFLPLLVYQVSAFSSWREIKKNLRPIVLLSVGHVVFITLLVAFSIHALIPWLGWPLSFVLGAVISPPDDVAIISIAENIHIPKKLFTILEGEAMFNDAAALILFRFSLIALMTHEFSVLSASTAFVSVVIGETLYGIVLGTVIGKLRLKLTNPSLHVMASLLTPFLAYIPMVKLGGCGIIATVITGFIIGNKYSLYFTPEFRLISRAIWPALANAIQGVLFLLVGCNIRTIFDGVAAFSFKDLGLYALVVIGVAVGGRFIWEFVFVSFLPRILIPGLRKKDPFPPWQYQFLISWAGMRGAVSLAAALSIPLLPTMENGISPRYLIIFLVCCVIIATLLIQGMSLPWLIKKMGIHQHGQREQYNEHLSELSAKIEMTKSALKWLVHYKNEIKDNLELLSEIKIYIRQYKMTLLQLKDNFSKHNIESLAHNEIEDTLQGAHLLTQIAEVERETLMTLWQLEKINFSTRNRLINKLDHRIQHLGTR